MSETAPAERSPNKRLLRTLAVLIACAAIWLGVEVEQLAYKQYRIHFPKVYEVIPGVLYRSPQLRHTTPTMLKRYGIKTVVNMRTVREDPDALARQIQYCNELGVRHVHMPVGGFTPSDEQLAEFLRIVRAGTGPVLVHCQHGKERTGIAVAAYRIVVQDWTVHDAMEEMTEYGFKYSDAGTAERKAQLERIRANREDWLARTAPLPPASAAEAPAVESTATQPAR